MKRQLLLLLALLFCSIGTALAQKVIHGTVISKDDSEPIMGATVRVVGHNVGLQPTSMVSLQSTSRLGQASCRYRMWACTRKKWKLATV